MSDNTMQPLIRVRGLKKSFGDLDVLKGIDVDINKGMLFSLSALPTPERVRSFAV